MSDEALRRVDALIQVGMRIARSAPTGKVALAKLAGAIDLRWLSGPRAQRIATELDAAHVAASEQLEIKRVERALQDAWGTRPADELDELDPEPVAIRPGSQVHRGALDAAAVAIKVLRPGLAASVRQDLTLLEGVITPLAAAFPTLDARAILRESRERVLDELDLEHEAQAQRRFHRALRDHPFLTVPAPLTRLCHEQVLVSEWVDGVPLTRAPDKDDAAAKLVVFAIGAARSTGMIHADVDPDDVLVLPDGRLAILDFGATRTVDRRRLEPATAALTAFTGRDEKALGAALEQLGWLPAIHAATALALGHNALGDLAAPGPQRLDSDAVMEAGRRLFAHPDQLGELITAGAIQPEDLWPVRGIAQLFSTIARVGATAPWSDLAQAALKHGWDARRLG